MTAIEPAINSNRLLIIDDDPDIRDVFRSVAESIGYLVDEADNQLKFAEAYDQLQPTAILLDLSMPKVDGVEILRDLAQRSCRSRIMLASGQDERVLLTVQRLGRMLGLKMSAVLQKPVSIDVLEKRLKSTLNNSLIITPESIENALLQDQFVLHYQAKVDLQSAEDFPVIGAEGLVRWQHPEHGLIAPAEFLPIVEEVGLINRMTANLLEQAIKQLVRWKGQGFNLPVSINLSPRQLMNLSLPDRISELLASAGLNPALLMLEITEQAAMENMQMATDILTRLRLKNIDVALDDFGAGYSSLVEIYRLPLSELKIDRSLVVDLDEDSGARTVMRGIQAMARELKLPLCVEGVETMKTAVFLRSIGCAKAQGFLFSKALPPDEYFEYAIQNSNDAGSESGQLPLVN